MTDLEELEKLDKKVQKWIDKVLETPQLNPSPSLSTFLQTTSDTFELASNTGSEYAGYLFKLEGRHNWTTVSWKKAEWYQVKYSLLCRCNNKGKPIETQRLFSVSSSTLWDSDKDKLSRVTPALPQKEINFLGGTVYPLYIFTIDKTNKFKRKFLFGAPSEKERTAWLLTVQSQFVKPSNTANEHIDGGSEGSNEADEDSG